MFLLYRLFGPIEDPEWTERGREALEGQYPSFTVEATKENLNRLIEQELEKEDPDREYNIFLDDEVHFQASFTVIGQQIPVDMNLKPEITDDGNIILQETSFKVGQLNLPSEQIFRMMASVVDLPDWVYINSSESNIFLHLQEGISDELVAEAEEFNLEEDNIRFRIYLTEKNEAP